MIEVQIRRQLNNGHMLDVRFSSEDGVSLLGGKGSGKSVLLACLAGLTSPNEGRIVLQGRVLYDSMQKIDLAPQERRVGLLSADPGLFPGLTVNENVQLALCAGGRSQLSGSRESRGTALQERTKAYLHDFGLDGLGGCYPKELSPVQTIRTAAARMMAAEPSLILLDNPFRDLESYTAARLLLELRDQFETKGLPVIFASDDRNEVYAMHRQVIALQDGRGQPESTPEDFFAHPETISAALLAGVCNVTHVRMLNPTHAASGAWGVVFCLDKLADKDAREPASGRETDSRDRMDPAREPGAEPAQTAGKDSRGEKDKPGDRATAGGSAEERDGLTAALDSAAAQKSEERRRERQEDLARSLRFELIPTDADPGKEPLLPAAVWKKLPEDLAAAGCRPDAFVREEPAGEPHLRLRLHGRRIEEDLEHWKVYFHPCPEGTEGGSELLWEVPRRSLDRQQVEETTVLYLPLARLLLLRDG